MSADRFKQAAKANDSGSWNKYSYVQNDPVNGTDPKGQYLACILGDDETWEDDGDGCEYAGQPAGGGGGPEDVIESVTVTPNFVQQLSDFVGFAAPAYQVSVFAEVEAFLGPTVTITYVVPTKQICVGGGLALGQGKTVTAGPVVVTDPSKIIEILSGGSWSAGVQLSNFVGWTLSYNSSGTSAGPTVSNDAGMTVGYSYTLCSATTQ